jgi:hypothetical protein
VNSILATRDETELIKAHPAVAQKAMGWRKPEAKETHQEAMG